jgi:hypothetical protein
LRLPHKWSWAMPSTATLIGSVMDNRLLSIVETRGRKLIWSIYTPEDRQGKPP